MVPMLDWRRFSDAMDPAGFVAEMSEALAGPGFFRLSHHGIDAAIVEAAFRDAAKVFDLTEAEKRTLANRPGPFDCGWDRIGVERGADGAPVLQRRETFSIGLDLPPGDSRVAMRRPFRAETPWPSIPGFQASMLEYFDALLALGISLHRAIALDLDLPEAHFDSRFEDPLATLRLVNYPPGTGRGGEAGVAAHTDAGAISLLATDSEPGLQAQLRSGDWVDIDPVPDSFLVLVGDALECWSGGHYKATVHRVQPPSRRRQSISFYLHPAPDVPMAPLPGRGDVPERPTRFADHLAAGLAGRTH